MAISLKSVTVATNATTAATFTCTSSETPTATAIGDLVVVFHANDFYAATNLSTPSATGTPTMNAIASMDAGTNEGHIKAWWYVANTAGAQVVTATETGTHDEEKMLAVVVLGGADTTTPVDDAQTGFDITAQATHLVPSVAPASSTAYLVALDVTLAGTATASFTASAPLTNQAYFTIGGAFTGELMTGQLSASGATGTISVTPATSQPYGAVNVAIKTAGAGGGAVLNSASPAWAPMWRTYQLRR